MDKFIELDNLKDCRNYEVELLSFKKPGDIVLIITDYKGKTILSGKAAKDLVDMVTKYLDDIYQKYKGSK